MKTVNQAITGASRSTRSRIISAGIVMAVIATVAPAGFVLLLAGASCGRNRRLIRTGRDLANLHGESSTCESCDSID